MSYQVLARKWRPQQFGDMIGQEHVLKALVNALDTDRLHHAYLFTGMRGVGKTTIARIFAKCLNCERVDGVTATPCGECSTCQDIEAGRFFDLIEVDAASRTKVDETRELLENVPYAPTSGRYKVYLIDEVHMFSNHSFNALLKTLEEPPAHVKFLLATTDPQKVPVTVLSRCLQFNLKRMVPARLADYLEKILNEESIGFERGALDLIARAADGSVRDSLSLVEQAAAYGQGSVKIAEVESMLGRVSVARLLDVLSALADNAVQPLFEKITELAEYAPDYHELLGELLSLTHRIALLQSVPGSVEPDATELDQLQALADRVSAEDLQLWYQIGMHARRDMPYAPDPREAFDMAILRMLAFAPQGASGSAVSLSSPSSVGSVAPSGGGASSRPAQAAKPTSQPTPTPAAGSAAAPANSAAKPKSAAPTPAAVSVTASNIEPDVNTQEPAAMAEPASEVSLSAMDRKAQLDAALGRTPKKKVANDVSANVARVAVASVAAVAKPPVAAAPVAAPPVVAVEVAAAPSPVLPFNNDNWPMIVRRITVSGLPMQLAMNCAVADWQAGVLALRLASPAQHLNKPAAVEKLSAELSDYCGEPVTVRVELTKDALVTPTRLMEQVARQAQKDAEASIENDPLLAELLSRVDGEVTKNSVRPIQADAIEIADNGENS